MPSPGFLVVLQGFLDELCDLGHFHTGYLAAAQDLGQRNTQSGLDQRHLVSFPSLPPPISSHLPPPSPTNHLSIPGLWATWCLHWIGWSRSPGVCSWRWPASLPSLSPHAHLDPPASKNCGTPESLLINPIQLRFDFGVYYYFYTATEACRCSTFPKNDREWD